MTQSWGTGSPNLSPHFRSLLCLYPVQQPPLSVTLLLEALTLSFLLTFDFRCITPCTPCHTPVSVPLSSSSLCALSGQGSTKMFWCVRAIPISDITAETVAQAFICSWIARFGTPSTISTDRGRQPESELFTHFMQLLGTKRIRTTAYPFANGLVERLHVSSRLLSKRNLTQPTELTPYPWCYLASVLLSRKTSHCTAAELVYSTTLRLPSQFFSASFSDIDPISFVQRLKSTMQQLHAPPVVLIIALFTFPIASPHVYMSLSDMMLSASPYDIPMMSHTRYKHSLPSISTTSCSLRTTRSLAWSLSLLKVGHLSGGGVSVAYSTHRHTMLYFKLASVFAILASM